MHRSAPRYNALEKVNVYTITISLIENGKEYVLPYTFEQSTNAEYVQMPENSTLTVEFKAMGGGAGDKDYDNTIFVDSGKKKANGEKYYTFMHPGAYGAKWLAGCMLSSEKMLPNGAPDIGDGKYYDDPDYMDKAQAESVKPLTLMSDLYTSLGIGDEGGVFEGNAFQMKTNSVAEENIEIIKMKPREIKLVPVQLPSVDLAPSSFIGN